MNSDLIIIPKNLAPIAPILAPYLTPLLFWFSNLIYQRLLASQQGHLLCRLHALLDFTELETACATYHCLNGNGRPVCHTVPQLLRAMLVKYLYGCSLRELEEKIRCHLLVKWFVGCPIFAAGPDHTSLHRFELFLYLHHPRLFFDTVLRQIDAAFPAERRHPQLGDTCALHATSARQWLIHWLRPCAVVSSALLVVVLIYQRTGMQSLPDDAFRDATAESAVETYAPTAPSAARERAAENGASEFSENR